MASVGPGDAHLCSQVTGTRAPVPKYGSAQGPLTQEAFPGQSCVTPCVHAPSVTVAERLPYPSTAAFMSPALPPLVTRPAIS